MINKTYKEELARLCRKAIDSVYFEEYKFNIEKGIIISWFRRSRKKIKQGEINE